MWWGNGALSMRWRRARPLLADEGNLWIRKKETDGGKGAKKEEEIGRFEEKGKDHRACLLGIGDYSGCSARAYSPS